MKWHTKGIREPETFEFLLSEQESTLPSPELELDTSNRECYTIHKGIRISLRPIKGQVREAMFEILSVLDSKFTLNMQGIQRSADSALPKGNMDSFP